jgi:glycosyltransferase involved in cell wall biosynthesis
LPPAEAMCCGSALVCTDIGGHREYAIPGQTALLSAPKSPSELARNIRRLLEDPIQRAELALRGHEYISQFTWARAASKISEILTAVSPKL